MKKVLIISNIPSPYRTALFRYLQTQQKDYRFQVLYTSRAEADRAWSTQQELEDTFFQDSKVLSVKGGEVGGTATRFIHIPRGLGAMLEKICPDVIIGSEYNLSAVQAYFWAKSRRVPYINLTDGTLHSETYIGKVQKLTRKLIISGADGFLASSGRAKEKLLHWGAAEKKIVISYLTVPLEPFLALARRPEPGRILFVGRISHEKGLDLLVRALAEVKTSCRLRVVGNDVGGEQTRVRTLIRELGLEDRVEFLGYREGELLLEEYSKCALLAVPSRSDCFGLVMVEAACAGVPVLASKYADGGPDILREGENGLTADPFDPAAFGEALEEMLNRDFPTEKSRVSLGEKFSFREAARGYVQAVRMVEGEK